MLIIYVKDPVVERSSFIAGLSAYFDQRPGKFHYKYFWLVVIILQFNTILVYRNVCVVYDIPVKSQARKSRHSVSLVTQTPVC